MPRDRICVAIDRNAKQNAWVSVASYRCMATNRQVIVNNSLAPYSPYSGRNLKQLANTTVELPIKEIRKELTNIGDCPTCESSHYMFPKEAKQLAGKQVHCIICTGEIDVPPDVGTKNSVVNDKSAGNDDNDDQEARRRKNRDKNNNNADNNTKPELVAAADDNDDNNDNATADDNNNDNDSTVSGNDNDDAAGSGDNDNNDNDDASADNTDAPVAPVPVATEPGAATPNPTPPAAAINDSVAPDAAPGTETGDGTGEEKSADDNDNDDADDWPDSSELVSASSKSVIINCFARCGGIAGKRIQFIPVSARLGLLLADDQPVITLDADKAGDNKELFAEPDALTKAVKTILEQEENPTPESFAALGGAPIIFSIPTAEAIKQRIESGIQSVTAAFTERRQKLLEEMRACLSVAALIINKNIDRELTNPLRDALVGSLRNLNVRSADTVVDQAFIAASEDYIRTVLAKADNLYQQPLETRNEIARFVERTPYTTIASEDKSDGNFHADKFRKSNVGLSTARTAPDPEPPPAQQVVAGALHPNVAHYRNLLRK
jgi:hypothetical protein